MPGPARHFAGPFAGRPAGPLAGLALVALLAACGRVIPPPSQPPLTPSSALLAGVVPGPPVTRLGLSRGDAAAGLGAFRRSCTAIRTRSDASGLTRPEDWAKVCDAAARYADDPQRFFAEQFETARVGSGAAFATGYFEPQIRGSRTRRPGYDTPVYALPSDLVRQWPADMPASERTGRPPLGRIDASGRFVPYYSRAEIEDGALAGRGLEIAWVADPVEFFFLQVQGSGRLITPEGDVIRIGYAGQNGRGYTGIGAVMRERGLIGDGPGQYPGSMQGIIAYIHDHPDEGRALMRLNESWVFFRELTGDGPLGSLGVPVERESSVAVDPSFVPYGAPVWLDLDRKEANGLWIAQDTGGAIKGPNRFDTFWGAGDDARTIAGGMSGRGQALILVPKGTLARLKPQ